MKSLVISEFLLAPNWTCSLPTPTNEVVASSIMNFLFDERNKNKDIIDGELIDPLSIQIPADFIPEDIVDGEISDIVKNNDLDVDDFMPTERD